jgi:hypothetical protein
LAFTISGNGKAYDGKLHYGFSSLLARIHGSIVLSFQIGPFWTDAREVLRKRGLGQIEEDRIGLEVKNWRMLRRSGMLLSEGGLYVRIFA